MSKRKTATRGLVTVLTKEEYLRQQAASATDLEIRLTNNYAFKKIFRNPEVLKGFLMSQLRLKEEDIQRIDVADPFEEGETEDEKEGILDIKIHLNDDRKINLEMQNYYQDDWSERSLFYLCRNFVEGFRHGQPYRCLEPCLHLGILNFNQTASDGFHHEFLLQEQTTGEIYSSKIGIHVIELKKIKEGLPEDADDCERELFRWASIMAANSWKEVEALAKGNPYMEAAENEMRKISLDENQRYLYLREEMAISDRVSQLTTAMKEGEKRGEKRGEKIKLIAQIRKKYIKQKSAEVIAAELEEPVEVIRSIYGAIQASPGLTDQEIYERLFHV